MGVNKVIVLGNVGRDPEVRPVGETKVANFSLATTDRRFKDKTTGKPKTEWHNIVAWGKLADIIGQYVTKGDALYLEGRIQTRSWEDDSGTKKYMTEIVADQMEMLGGNKDKPKPQAEAVGEVPFGDTPAADDPGF